VKLTYFIFYNKLNLNPKGAKWDLSNKFELNK
jgi:hypothetical protein